MSDEIVIRNCPDCNAEPGTPHLQGCDVERCSVCADQAMCCDCEDHDPLFSRWTGFWPGEIEAKVLGVDLNEIHSSPLYRKAFFTKPKKPT